MHNIFPKAKWKSLQVFLVLLPARNNSNLIHKWIPFLLLNSFVQISLLWKGLATARHRLILLIRCESRKICKFLNHRKEASVASLTTSAPQKYHSSAVLDTTSDLLAAALQILTSHHPHTPPKHSNMAKSRVLSQDLGNFQPYSNSVVNGLHYHGQNLVCSVRELSK